MRFLSVTSLAVLVMLPCVGSAEAQYYRNGNRFAGPVYSGPRYAPQQYRAAPQTYYYGNRSNIRPMPVPIPNMPPRYYNPPNYGQIQQRVVGGVQNAWNSPPVAYGRDIYGRVAPIKQARDAAQYFVSTPQSFVKGAGVAGSFAYENYKGAKAAIDAAGAYGTMLQRRHYGRDPLGW